MRFRTKQKGKQFHKCNSVLSPKFQLGFLDYTLQCLFLQELECLQDHLDDLVSDCRDIVGNLTELESEVSGFQPGVKGIDEQVQLSMPF